MTRRRDRVVQPSVVAGCVDLRSQRTNTDKMVRKKINSLCSVVVLEVGTLKE